MRRLLPNSLQLFPFKKLPDNSRQLLSIKLCLKEAPLMADISPGNIHVYPKHSFPKPGNLFLRYILLGSKNTKNGEDERLLPLQIILCAGCKIFLKIT
jgi:hypothetical protein